MPRGALSVFARIRRDLMVELGGEKAEVRIPTKDALRADWPNRASLTYV